MDLAVEVFILLLAPRELDLDIPQALLQLVDFGLCDLD